MGLGSGKGHKWFIGSNKLTEKNLKVGQNITQEAFNERGSTWIVTEVVGDGKFKAVSYPDFVEKMDRELSRTGKVITRENALKLIQKDNPGLVQTYDLGADTQVQQYIELTPEVVAKIQGKAPNLKLNRDITTYGIPLLMLYFSQGGNQ